MKILIIANALKYSERLLQPILLFILVQYLIIFADRGHEDYRGHILKTEQQMDKTNNKSCERH